jgi:hypothetical protein
MRPTSLHDRGTRDPVTKGASGAAGALFMGVSGFIHLPVPVPGVLFNVFALLVTLWALLASLMVWRMPHRSTVALAEAVAPA